MEFEKNRPLYLQVKEDILKRLENAEWQEGEQIPTESEFIEQYQTSRATIRHALGEIESDGLIERHPGIGTIVSKERIKPELLKITSFSKDMSQRGLSAKSITVDMDFQIPPKRVREGLQLLRNEKVWRVRRLRLANDEPMGLQDLYIPPDLKVSARDMQNMQSYYKLLSEQYQMKPAYGNESITATIANETEAELLRIPIGEPLIFIWRTTFSVENQPMEVVKIFYVAKRYEYHLKLYGAY